MANLNQRTLDNAEKLEAEIQIEDGTMSLKEDWYDRFLPEKFEGETPVEIAKEVHAVDLEAFHGTSLAFGRVGVNTLKANENLAFVTGETNIGISTLHVKVEREGVVTVPPKEAGGEASKKQVFGKTSVALKTKSSAEVARIRSEVSTLATGFFGK